MIQISACQETIYKLLKNGVVNVRTISLNIGKGEKWTRKNIHQLEEKGLVKTEKVGIKLNISHIDAPFKVKRETNKRPAPTGEGQTLSEFDAGSYRYNFTDQQKAAIAIFKKEKTYEGERMERTQFAKKIGAPKLHVTFALGAMR